MNTEDPRGHPGAVRRPATVLESVEDIRALIRAATANQGAETAATPRGDRTRDTQPFRPSSRPSMALLCVLDDGDDSGELVRIRDGTFVIGRVEGNLVIPHDGGISGRHAEIGRRIEHGEPSWYLRDLQSTNGTFVRAASVVLQQDQELLIGGCRFRFEASAPPIESAGAAAPNTSATRKWDAPSALGSGAATPPALVEISPGRAAHPFPLVDREHWLGRDPRQCSIVVDDPMVDPRHARIYRDEKTKRWIVANARSLNGLWARIQEVSLGRGGSFQCGEQRFILKVL